MVLIIWILIYGFNVKDHQKSILNKTIFLNKNQFLGSWWLRISNLDTLKLNSEPGPREYQNSIYVENI